MGKLNARIALTCGMSIRQVYDPNNTGFVDMDIVKSFFKASNRAPSQADLAPVAESPLCDAQLSM